MRRTASIRTSAVRKDIDETHCVRCNSRCVSPPADSLPSQRGETWNDTDAINRHREMTPSQRIALAIEASRAALLFAARAGRDPDSNCGKYHPRRCRYSGPNGDEIHHLVRGHPGRW